MFTSARIKLTAWYLLIVTMLSLSFSLIIYQSLTREIDRISHMHELRIERRAPNPFSLPNTQPPNYQSLPRGLMANYFLDPELISETKHRIIIYLIIFNSSVLVISGGLGFFLAGKTLSPIEKMIGKQNRFISDAAHELKTPLASLKTTFEVYLRDPKNTKQDGSNLIKESISEVNKLQSLSESLLTLSRYDANNESSFELLDISSIIQTTINNFSSSLKLNHLKVNFNPKLTNIIGDQQSITQLFTIIIDNAIKYSQSKSSSIDVSLHTYKKYVDVVIQDHGIGISPKDLPFVFDRFYQSQQARTKTSNSGYGLGLSIAKQIVNYHKGTITVTSKFDQGTCITVRFPLPKSSK